LDEVLGTYGSLFNPASQIARTLNRAANGSGVVGGCVDDVTNRTNSCTANDVVVSRLEVLEVIDGCDYPGDTATATLRAVFDATANERYDLGFFSALDGGDARTGECYHDYLNPLSDTVPYSPTSGVGGFWNAEQAEDSSDTCGDIERGVETYYDLLPISFVCVDEDGDGLAEIDTCLSWDNTRNNTCDSVDDAVPNTRAKCWCGSNTINIVVPVPAGEIDVIKTAEPTTVDEPGEVVTYTVIVSNVSDVPVTVETITDTRYGVIDASSSAISGTTCSVPQDIAPDDAYTCTFSAFVGGHAGTLQTNVVEVSGTDDNGNPVFDRDDAQVKINDVLPLVSLCKAAEPLELGEPGGVFTFTLTFANNSPGGEAVTITQLLDDWRPFLDFSDCEQYEGTVLPAGEIFTCTYTHTLSAPGAYTNTARAVVKDNEGNTASDGCEAEVAVIDVLPTVDLVKTADPTSCQLNGSDCVFTYALSISNTSPVSVTITELADTQASAVDYSECSGLVNNTLDPHTGTSCTYTRTLSGEGTYTNTARVAAVDAQLNQAGDRDGESVTIGALPMVKLLKTVEPLSRDEPGGVFSYTLTISNTSSGEGEVVTITKFTDTYGDVAVDAFADCDVLVGTNLNVGESALCTYTRTLTLAGTYPNTATVTVEDADENPASDFSVATAVVNDVQPLAILTKTVEPISRDEPGGVFTYTIEIRNASPVTVEITSLTDTASGETDFSACNGLVGTVLQAGESIVCTYARLLTAPGVYTNTARVEVADAQGNPAEDLAEEQAEVIDLLAFIEIIKVPQQDTVTAPGEDVTFDVTINNLSEVDTVTVISLTDSLFGDLTQRPGNCAVGQSIPAGGSYQCSFTGPVSGEPGDAHINQVRVEGLDDMEQPVRDDGDTLVLVLQAPPPVGGATLPTNPLRAILPWTVLAALVGALAAGGLVWKASPNRGAD
ncbi:MAG: hypothetical protein PVG71_13290, partial [Anaerolineae bacterium]